jgi:hypothetical protein
MIRQLPAGYALTVRSGHAPVIVKLPMGWKDHTYRSARRTGGAIAQLAAVAGLGALPPARPEPPLDPDFANLTPEDVIRSPRDDTRYPWDEEPS